MVFPLAPQSPHSLTARAGLIQDITFASFGTPTGSCGSYVLGSCNAKDSLKVCCLECPGRIIARTVFFSLLTCIPNESLRLNASLPP